MGRNLACEHNRVKQSLPRPPHSPRLVNYREPIRSIATSLKPECNGHKRLVRGFLTPQSSIRAMRNGVLQASGFVLIPGVWTPKSKYASVLVYRPPIKMAVVGNRTRNLVLHSRTPLPLKLRGGLGDRSDSKYTSLNNLSVLA